MINGWTVFARRIIEELKKYDAQEGMDYAYYMTDKNGQPAEFAVTTLATIMARVDKQSQWEPVQQKVKAND